MDMYQMFVKCHPHFNIYHNALKAFWSKKVLNTHLLNEKKYMIIQIRSWQTTAWGPNPDRCLVQDGP